MLTPQEIQDTYMDNGYIKECQLSSLEDLYLVFKWWLKLSRKNTIGNIEIVHRQTRIIKLKLGSKYYYINADTTRDAVKKFVKNKENPLSNIHNRDGKINLVTNSATQNKINGLYFYIDI